jgi:hypothetical protein
MPKKLPKPFKRPGIDLDYQEIKRTWQTVPWSQVRKGDIIPDSGEVQHVHHPSETTLKIEFPENRTTTMPVEVAERTRVFAFTEEK